MLCFHLILRNRNSDPSKFLGQMETTFSRLQLALVAGRSWGPLCDGWRTYPLPPGYVLCVGVRCFFVVFDPSNQKVPQPRRSPWGRRRLKCTTTTNNQDGGVSFACPPSPYPISRTSGSTSSAGSRRRATANMSGRRRPPLPSPAAVAVAAAAAVAARTTVVTAAAAAAGGARSGWWRPPQPSQARSPRCSTYENPDSCCTRVLSPPRWWRDCIYNLWRFFLCFSVLQAPSTD